MIIAVLALAFGIRLININQSFWLDEAINVVYAKQLSFWQFVTSYPIGDFHPPGWFAILWITTHIFGFSEISARLPSLLLGIGTVYLIYLIGKQLFNKRVALISSLLLALAPLHIYYSQEARMYSLAAFAATLSTYYFIKLVKGKGVFMDSLYYFLSLLLVFSSDYLAYLIIPVHLFHVFFFHKKDWVKLSRPILVSFIFLIPLSGFFIRQLDQGLYTAKNLPGWGDIVGGFGLKEAVLLPVKILIGRISPDNKLIYIALIIAVSLPYIAVLLKTLKIKAQENLLWTWVILPPLFALIISLFIPVFAYFRVLFILPAFYLLTALGISKYKKLFSNIILLLIILIQFTASTVYLINPKFHREDWRSAVNYVEANSNRNALSVFVTDGQTAPYVYYSEYAKNKSSYSKSVPWSFESKWQSQNPKTIWLFRYLQPVFDPDEDTLRSIEEAGYQKLEEKDFNQIVIWRYLKID